MNVFTASFLNQLIADSTLLRSIEIAQSNIERLQILHVRLNNEPGFCESLQNLASVGTKDLQRSLEAKNLGVRDFAAKRCHAALVKTNESLSMAPPECDFLPHLFGNRSAICFDLENYEDALVNIELALTHKMPDLLQIKLLFRKAKCLQILKDAEGENVYEDCMDKMSVLLACLKKDAPELKQSEDFKRKMQESWKDLKESTLLGNQDYKNTKRLIPDTLKHSVEKDADQDFKFSLSRKNEHFPVASAKIVLAANPQFGRGVFAVEDISPGDAVVLEEATVSVLHPSDRFRLTQCHYCLKRNPSRLVPCDKCDALFCNDQCRDACDESTHDAECRVLPSIKQMPLFGIIEMLALRFVLHEIRKGATINDLCQRVSAFENSSPDFESLAYQLETNEAGREPSDMLARVFKSLILCQLLRTTNFFANTTNSNTDIINNYASKNNDDNYDSRNKISSTFDFDVFQFGALLVHYFQVVACNAHDINTFFASPPNGKVTDDDQVQIGSALYPFCSMFNHSCDPNVVRHSFRGSSVMVSALKRIRKGDQLFDNYGCHYATMSKPQRQKYLWEQYRFRCCCRACQEDYPLYQPDREEPITFKDHYNNEKTHINNNNNSTISNKNNKSNTSVENNKKNHINTTSKIHNNNSHTTNTDTNSNTNNNNTDNTTFDHLDLENTNHDCVFQSIETFNSILSEIFESGHRTSDLGRKLTIVKRHLELLDRCVERPHQEFEKAQETYKRLLAYLTNCEMLADGEEIPERP